MKKIFISQPMKGKTNKEIMDELRLASIIATSIYRKNFDCKKEEIEILSPYMPDTAFVEKPLYLLGQSLCMLSQADAVYFADGWQKARGCRIEHECADQYGILIL